jgi:hypothetical protein
LRNIKFLPWRSARMSWMKNNSLDTSTTELFSFSSHNGLRMPQIAFTHFVLKNVNHSANARTFWKPSYLTVGKNFILWNIHKITLLSRLFDSKIVGMEILIDF